MEIIARRLLAPDEIVFPAVLRTMRTIRQPVDIVSVEIKRGRTAVVEAIRRSVRARVELRAHAGRQRGQ